jgi:hypothetical protein
MTQQQMDRLDRLVDDYLGAVSYACADLDPQRRDELIEELREHISAARGALYEQTEAAVRTILDRLGEPAAIAAEARLGEPGLSDPPAASPVASPVGAGSRETRRWGPSTLGMWLGFFLMVIVILVGAAVFIMFASPEPTNIPAP